MPDLPSIPGSDDSAALADANRAVDTLLENSRRDGDSGRPEITPARESALDEAFKSVTTDPANPTEPGRENGGVVPPVEGTPAAKPASVAEPVPVPETKSVPVPTPESKSVPPAKKGLLGDLLLDPEVPKPVDHTKVYDDIVLRSDASPKTKESFEMQRTRAIGRETAVRTELEAAHKVRLELETRLTALEQKAGQLPDSAAAELKDLREFRALHDVSSRPEFKEKFDAKITANYEAAYTMFTQEGMSAENLAALRNLPESDRLDFIEKNVLPKLTPGQKRVVEAKLFDNVNITEERGKALTAARTDAERILAEQRDLPQRQQREADVKFADVLRPLLQRLPYIYTKDIPATATPAEKAALETRNAFAAELQESVKTAITATDPETRAEAVLAVPLAKYLSRENKTLQVRVEAAEAKLAAIRKAGGTGRLGQAAAGAPATPATSVRGTDTDGDSAVDQLFRQVSGVPAA